MSALTAEKIADNLRAAIHASPLSQQQVADALGMGKSNLSKMLSAQRRVTALDLARICEITGADVLDILEVKR